MLEGDEVGIDDGVSVGCIEGDGVGGRVPVTVGLTDFVGKADGTLVGKSVGELVGVPVGEIVGAMVGFDDKIAGTIDGAADGSSPHPSS